MELIVDTWERNPVLQYTRVPCRPVVFHQFQFCHQASPRHQGAWRHYVGDTGTFQYLDFGTKRLQLLKH